LSRLTVRGINISGVDFWHAVEFSRNGRFLRNRFTGFSGRFPSVFPTLPDPFSGPFPVRIPFPAPCWSGVFRAFRRVHYVSGFPPRLIIEPPGRIPGTPKSIPMRGRAVVVCADVARVAVEEPYGSVTTRRTLHDASEAFNHGQPRGRARPERVRSGAMTHHALRTHQWWPA
jgi:hypothetical protein